MRPEVLSDRELRLGIELLTEMKDVATGKGQPVAALETGDVLRQLYVELERRICCAETNPICGMTSSVA
jgi:hypothetical protein